MTATSVRNDLWREQCPVCGNAVIDQIGKVPVSGDVEYSTHSVVLERVPEIWKCHACGSWFTQNAVPEATALALYASGNSGTRWLAEPFETAKNIELVGEFDRHIGAQTKILPIAPGKAGATRHKSSLRPKRKRDARGTREQTS